MTDQTGLCSLDSSLRQLRCIVQAFMRLILILIEAPTGLWLSGQGVGVAGVRVHT
jgi:hypothetical protein